MARSQCKVPKSTVLGLTSGTIRFLFFGIVGVCRMLEITEATLVALSRQADQSYARKLAAWIRECPELAALVDQATLPWCEESLHLARQFDMASEDNVARFARLRLLRGDKWLQGPHADEILRSSRDSQLKAFQLECSHWGFDNG